MQVRHCLRSGQPQVSAGWPWWPAGEQRQVQGRGQAPLLSSAWLSVGSQSPRKLQEGLMQSEPPCFPFSHPSLLKRNDVVKPQLVIPCSVWGADVLLDSKAPCWDEPQGTILPEPGWGGKRLLCTPVYTPTSCGHFWLQSHCDVCPLARDTSSPCCCDILQFLLGRGRESAGDMKERGKPWWCWSRAKQVSSPHPPLGEHHISMESRNHSFCLVKTRPFSIFGFCFCWKETRSEILPTGRELN